MPKDGAIAKEAIVFDIDGTLIEVGGSYKKAIIETASYYLPNEPTDIIEKEMIALKTMPNFNNDWDATYYIVKKLSGSTPKVDRDDFWLELRDIFQSYYLGEELFFESYQREPPIQIKKGLITTETPLICESTLM